MTKEEIEDTMIGIAKEMFPGRKGFFGWKAGVPPTTRNLREIVAILIKRTAEKLSTPSP